MTHIFIGCDKIFGNRKGYFNHLSALEVDETAHEKLTDATLGRWRTESPKGFAFVMAAHHGVTHPAGAGALEGALEGCAPAGVGHLQDSEAVHKAWGRTMEMARALSPKLILLRTPLSFTPSQENRDRLEWFARTLAPQAREVKAMVAWEPHGLWDLAEAVPMARQLGLVPAYDPFSDLDLPTSPGTALFPIYSRRGLRTTFNDFDMEDLLDLCEPFQRAIIVFRGTRRYRDARLAYTVWQARQGEVEDEEL